MLEDQDWEKVKQKVANNKNIQRYEEKTKKEHLKIEEREEKKTELRQKIRDLNKEISLLNGSIRYIRSNISSQDRAIVACQKRINENDFKIEKIRQGVIERQEDAALKRRRSEFRRKVLKDKIGELWQKE